MYKVGRVLEEMISSVSWAIAEALQLWREEFGGLERFQNPPSLPHSPTRQSHVSDSYIGEALVIKDGYRRGALQLVNATGCFTSPRGFYEQPCKDVAIPNHLLVAGDSGWEVLMAPHGRTYICTGYA